MIVRPIEAGDYEGWLLLWDGNNQGTRDERVTALTWARLNDSDFPMKGLIALENGQAIGLLHYISHPTTGSAKDVCYMQDVYVDPALRRKGIARALIQELIKIAQAERKWARIYWLADASNEAAQSLYKKLGVKMNFSLHILPL